MTAAFLKVLEWTVTAISICGLGCNLLLMTLIATKSSQSLGTYKFLLFSYSTIAMINTIASILTVPIYESSTAGWVFYATVHRLPRNIGSYFVCTYSATYIAVVIILTYSFVYRYFAMCSTKHMKWFKESKRILVLVIFFNFMVHLCCVPLYNYTWQNPLTESFHIRVSQGILDLELADVSYIGVPIWDQDGNVQWKTIILMALWMAVMCTAFSISAFCSLKIVQQFMKVEAMAAMSSRIRKLHYQLFVLLAYQTLIPMTLEFVPIMASYVFTYHGISLPTFAVICSLFLPIAKLVDPILIIAIITEYRRAFLETILCRKTISNRLTSTSQVGTDVRTHD